MLFEDALREMRAGKKIKRKYWDKEEYIHIVDGLLCNEDSISYDVVNASGCLDDCWEIYEEPMSLEVKYHHAIAALNLVINYGHCPYNQTDKNCICLKCCVNATLKQLGEA